MSFLVTILPYAAAVTALYLLGESAWPRRTIAVAMVTILVLGLGVGCQPATVGAPGPDRGFLVMVQLLILGVALGLGVLLDRLDPR